MVAPDASELSAQKRKLEDDNASKEEDADVSKRGAVGAIVPQKRHADFSPELLRIYYDKFFPFKGMFKWLSYGNNPKSQRSSEKDFFLRREFTFVLEGDVFCRYMCFRDVEEFRSQVTQRQPIRMEIGAVFSHPPKNHKTVAKDAYKPLERELVFDIDMDDYDDVRTCCTGAKLCMQCWTFMRAAIKSLERVLRSDFGFKHMMFVYSGRRGVHCWVADPAARQLSNEYRGAVAEYVSLHTPGANKVRAEVKVQADEVHPSVEEAYNICLHFFRDDPKGVLKAQDIFRKGAHLDNIVEQVLNVEERTTINRYRQSHPNASSSEIWRQLELLRDDRVRTAGSFQQKREAKMFLKDIVIQYTYPRLDIAVSKTMNHLLKSPFVVHPKTGRVCVPINPATADSFNPLEVPTIGRLVDELDRSGGNIENTSLKPYIEFFESGFLRPLLADCLKEKQGGAGELAALDDW